MRQTNEKLIKGIRSCSEKTARYLNKHFFPGIEKFVLLNSGSREDARDLYQDVLIIFYTKIRDPKFTLSSELYTFFFGIAKRRWSVLLRDRKKLTKEFNVEDFQLEDDTRTIEIELSKDRNYKLYLRHFEKLGARCKIILGLHFEGKKWKEIAMAIGTSSQSFVWKLKSECNKQLVESIKSDPDYPELKKTHDELTKEF